MEVGAILRWRNTDDSFESLGEVVRRKRIEWRPSGFGDRFVRRSLK
jgi:hypothetical protein